MSAARGKARRVPHLDRAALTRIFLFSIMALVGAALAGSYSLARLSERGRPDLSLSMPFPSPVAMTTKADAELKASGGKDRARIARASALARRSLDASPLNPQALRIIATGEAAEGRDPIPLVAAALDVSRRDVGSHLMQIEIEVQRGNVAAILRHYDQSLRVKPSVGATLYPILLSAIREPEVLAGGRKMVSTGPVWLPGMIDWTLGNPEFLPNLVPLVSAFPSRSVALNAGYGQAMIEALVGQRRYREAFAVHATYSSRAAATPGSTPGYIYRPIDWAVADGYDAGGELIDGRNAHVRFFAQPQKSGDFLTRMAALPVGRMQIRYRISEAQGRGGRIRMDVSCVGGGAAALQSEAPVANGVQQQIFSVAPGCSFQRIGLSVQAGDEAVEASIAEVSYGPV